MFTDAGISGALPEAKRPALQAMLTAVRAGQVDRVVVPKVDRLARSMRHLSPLLGDLDDRGVALVSVAEAFDSASPTGRMMRTMLGGWAELERDTIRERTAGGRIARLRDGGWTGGDAPLGFQVVRDDEGRNARLALHPQESAMIRRGVDLLLDAGMTTGEAAEVLNAEGLLPRKAPRWTAGLLRNHLVRGPWGGEWTYAKPAKRRKGLDLLPEPVTVPIPRLLEPDRHQALLRYLKTTTSPKTRAHVHPLSGLLYGPACDHPYQGVARRDRGFRRYRCGFSKDTGRGWTCKNADGKPAPTILADDLDDLVWAEVLKALHDPARLQAAAKEAMGLTATAHAVEADSLGQARQEVQSLTLGLQGAFAAGVQACLPQDVLEASIADLKERLARAKNDVLTLEAMAQHSSAQVQGLKAVAKYADLIWADLEQAGPALRQEVFRALNLRVKVTKIGDGGEPLKATVSGPDVLAILGVLAGQGTSPQERGVLSLENRTSR